MEEKDKFVIFIIEDNELFTAMLSFVLSKDKNIEIVAFHNAEDCILQFKSLPNLIVLDHNLDGMDGLKAMEIIKEIHKNVPIIIMSSQNDIDVVINYMNTGATDYIVKNNLGLDLIDQTIQRMKNGIIGPNNLLSQLYTYFIKK